MSFCDREDETVAQLWLLYYGKKVGGGWGGIYDFIIC